MPRSKPTVSTSSSHYQGSGQVELALVDVEDAHRILAEDLRALAVGQIVHLPFDREFGIGEAALVVRIVARPEQVILEPERHQEIEHAGMLERRGEAVAPEIEARRLRGYRPHPHVVRAIA